LKHLLFLDNFMRKKWKFYFW